jgi:magnesium chelatase subunit I
MRKHFRKVFLEKKDCFSDIIGQEKAKKEIKSALLMNRHIIIVGPPGVGKTTIAKSVASLLPDVSLLDCSYHCSPDAPLCPSCMLKKPKSRIFKGSDRFIRVQGSPDLTAEDLLGDIDPANALKFGPQSVEAFSPGKIFKANKGVLFFDELNRCPEKIQNSLLQVLEEGIVNIGPYVIDFPADFIFIGTMNPEETAAVEKLSDVFLDRFDIVHMSYPESVEREIEIVKAKAEKIDVVFPDDLLFDVLSFVRFLRSNKDLVKKPGVRASLGLFERACANAFLERRKVVDSGDVAEAVLSVLSHRISLKPSVKFLQSNEDFLASLFDYFSKSKDSLKKSGCL